MGRIRAGDSLRIATPLRFVLFTSQGQFFFHVFQRTWLTVTGGHFLLWKSLHPSVPVKALKTSAHARLATNNPSGPRICWHHTFKQVHSILLTRFCCCCSCLLFVSWPVKHMEHVCSLRFFVDLSGYLYRTMNFLDWLEIAGVACYDISQGREKKKENKFPFGTLNFSTKDYFSFLAHLYGNNVFFFFLLYC